MTKFLQEQQKLHEGAWSKGYHLFPQVLKSRAEVGVEIGVAFGGHAEAILKYTQVRKLYGVDSYQHIDGYEDPTNFSQPEFDALYARTKERLSPFRERFELIRTKSLEAVGLIRELLDFVYIDADHSYQGCLTDIKAWFPKVREGGIMGGHDYGSSSFPGVKQAVDQFFGHLGWAIHLEGYGCWWVDKQPLSKGRRMWLSLTVIKWKCCFRCKTQMIRLIRAFPKMKGLIKSFVGNLGA